MRIVAKEEQKRFWEMFDEALIQNGEPFYALHEMGGKTTHWAVINKNHALVDMALSIDFLVQKKIVRINIYMRDDIPLYNYLYSKRGEIEAKLGFSPSWNDNCQKPNTRRIEYIIPFVPGNLEDYDRVLDIALPIVEKFRTVFGAYIPNLFDSEYSLN